MGTGLAPSPTPALGGDTAWSLLWVSGGQCGGICLQAINSGPGPQGLSGTWQPDMITDACFGLCSWAVPITCVNVCMCFQGC